MPYLKHPLLFFDPQYGMLCTMPDLLACIDAWLLLFALLLIVKAYTATAPQYGMLCEEICMICVYIHIISYNHTFSYSALIIYINATCVDTGTSFN